MNFSVIQKNNSSVDIKENKINNLDLGLNYSYSFNKDNYISPFKNWDGIPLIGNAHQLVFCLQFDTNFRSVHFFC